MKFAKWTYYIITMVLMIVAYVLNYNIEEIKEENDNGSKIKIYSAIVILLAVILLYILKVAIV